MIEAPTSGTDGPRTGAGASAGAGDDQEADQEADRPDVPPDLDADPLPEIDTTKASIARVYDACLGGKDNYEVDRAVHARICEIIPEATQLAPAFRNWLVRVTRFLAGDAGIDQFLDCGSGLPTAENTHQVVQRVNPDAQVVYVDIDPMVAAHGRVLLEENDNTRFVVADLCEPERLLSHSVVTDALDLGRPIALMQSATLHHVPDSQRPWEIMARYIDALPSGSYVALSHFHDPADGSEYSEIARRIQRAFEESSLGSGFFRTREEIARLLDGLELLEPGLVRMVDWWPSGPRLKPLLNIDHLTLAALARKP